MVNLYYAASKPFPKKGDHFNTQMNTGVTAVVVFIYHNPVISVKACIRGRSRARVQGVGIPSEMTCSYLIQLVSCKKKNYVVYWC